MRGFGSGDGSVVKGSVVDKCSIRFRGGGEDGGGTGCFGRRYVYRVLTLEAGKVDGSLGGSVEVAVLVVEAGKAGEA